MAKAKKHIHSPFAAVLVYVCLILSLAGCAAKYKDENGIATECAEGYCPGG